MKGQFVKIVGMVISWVTALFILLFAIVELTTEGGMLSGLVLALLFLFLIPQLRHRVIRKIPNGRYKGIFTPLLALVFFFLAIAIAPSPEKTELESMDIANSVNESTTVEKNTTEQESTTEQKSDENDLYSAEEVPGELNQVDTDVIKVLTENGYSVEQASEIQKILNTVGITSIKIQSMTGQAGSGLNAVVCYPNEFVDDEEHRFYFTTDNGELFYAGFLNEDLYDADKGGYLKSYSDVHVPETEVTIEEYDYLTEEAKRQVKLLLNYPNTADFGMFDWGVGRSDEHYKIIGKVSAKNGFGGSQDIFFGVWFIKNESGRFSLEGIEFNGVRVK